MIQSRTQEIKIKPFMKVVDELKKRSKIKAELRQAVEPMESQI